jgi:hypothetical protein
MPLVRIIRDGIFIEEDKRCDTDDTPDVSEETAKLLYSRNWAVPYFKEDDFVVEHEIESNEVEQSEERENAEQTDETEIDLKPAPRRR